MNIKYLSYTDKGLQRKNNEDSLYAFKKDECYVFIVADGMGGYENGKNASDTIVKYVAEYIELNINKIIDAKKQFDKVYDSNTYFEDLKNCLLKANKYIYDNYTAKGHSSGSTLIMMAVYNDSYNIFSAGDSHIYQVIDDDLVALTVDDVWENDKSKTEGLTIDQLKSNKNLGRLTNAFGTIENVKINTTNGILAKGMRFFLCSDGVYKYCDEKKMKELILKDIIDENVLRDKLKEEIYKNEAPDNFSYIYVEVE